MWPWSVALHTVNCPCQTGPSSDPYTRKHGHSTDPKEPRLQKSSEAPKTTCCTQPTSSTPPSQTSHEKSKVFILTSSSCWKKTWIKHVWRGLVPLITGLKTTSPRRRETVSHAEVVEPTKFHANHPNCSDEKNDQPAQALPPGRRLGLSARHCDSCCRQRPCRQTAQSDQLQTPGRSSAMEVTTIYLYLFFTKTVHIYIY